MKRCGLRFGLLGPPVLYEVRAGTAVDSVDSVGVPDCAVRSISSPKVRALLAALLLEGGRVVSVESLMDVLWGGAPPASARASLHNHVARLRRLLDDPDRLRAVPPGYMLRVDDGELDVDVFVSRVAAARVAHAARDWERTVGECTAALALWRGAPLSGLPAEVGGYALVQRLAEARLLLLEWRFDAELSVGGPRLDALVPELAELAAEYPLRESFHRQLMLALHRTGRRAEALAVHRDLRTRLIEELGVEPGAGVREAHVAVLRGAGGGERAGERGSRGAAEGEVGRASRRVREYAADREPRGAALRSAGRVGGAGGGAVRGGAWRDEDGVAGSGAVSPEDFERHGAASAEAVRGDDAAVRPVPSPALRGAESSASSPSRESSDMAAPAASTDGGVEGTAAQAPGSRRGAEAPAASASPGPPRPAQLPPPPAYFTGRTTTLHALRRTLAPAPAPTLTPTPRPSTAIAVLSGMAGVGKSALALHAAHDLANRFPDGQLYVNLHGATPGMPPLTPGQALTALLRDLGADPRSIPEHPDAAAALLRSLLAPTRTLMVLDDAANAAQVRPLLPAGPGCAVIVTSRSPLTALDGARRFPLTPLSAEDSAALLRAASGRDGLQDGRNGHAGGAAHGIDGVHPLVRLTGGLPLALRVVAARLAARSALTPETLARQLTATESRLHHLEYDDLSVRRSLAVAHDALAASDREVDQDAAVAFRRIGALDLPAYGVPLLATLTGTDERRAEAALDRLVDVALLEETAYGRYAPHDLVRDFARELSESEGDFTGTALRWYAAVAERTLTAIVEPGLDQDDRRRPTSTQSPDHAAAVAAVPPFGSPESAFAWGDLELENVVALAKRHGAEPEAEAATGAESEAKVATGAVAEDYLTAPHLTTLIRLFFPYLQRSGRVAEMETLGRAALRLSRRLGDEAAEAYALGDLAGLHFLTGRQSEALSLNDRALTIWRRLGVVSWMRRCLNNRGLLLQGLGRHAESGQALRRSLEYSRQLNDPFGEAVTYSHLGNLYEHTDPRAAIEQHRRSLTIGDEIGHVIVQHSAHCNIGYAHLTLGEPAEAATHFEESLRILGGHGDWHGESQTRLGLVRALRLLGEHARAAQECAELLARADARADRFMGGLARHQHGMLLGEDGRVQEARDAWRTALEALDGTDEKEVVQELRRLLDVVDAG
ncbi:BTAD domain-containing putative transcriptional regulator [Streptomyces sp. M41]|uniref:AfsR/SARP family transcriptional regulator n=1 Tax=Streptomyces sp. M41 TaxID=3059412 RepID=UPI00374D4DC3